MTQEQKDLLFQDLCARLPYGVQCEIGGLRYGPYTFTGSDVEDLFSGRLFKPYLRPMESMTEKELREFAKLKFKNNDVWEIDEFLEMKFGFRGFINIKCRNRNSGDTWIYQVSTRTPLETYWGIDWLNANGFDYRGLIPMGLALEAPKDMYNIKI